MTVAIVGAGIQGCCAALELRMRGCDIVLFDRLPMPMEAASRWNEGKIHLGYLFANDPSLRTARKMIQGAMVFHARLARYLEDPELAIGRSSDFTYAVHRDSLLGADAISAHVARVDALVRDALAAPGADYLGTRDLAPSRELVAAEQVVDDGLVVRAIRTPEAAIDPQAAADRLAGRVLADPGIRFLGAVRMVRIAREDDGTFRLWDDRGESHGPFEAVVNASWESRIALDRTMGYEPDLPWIHRYKLAVHATGLVVPDGMPSVTIVLGAFGDVVDLGSGRVYLSWYPACSIATSHDLLPADPEPTIDDALRARVVDEVVAELRRIIPAVRDLDIDHRDIRVRGGHIFGWGETDITDVRSGLHERYAVGVHSDRGYHSVDTGKYGLAPLNAMTVAARIAGDA